jgi:hypothetical protein
VLRGLASFAGAVGRGPVVWGFVAGLAGGCGQPGRLADAAVDSEDAPDADVPRGVPDLQFVENEITGSVVVDEPYFWPDDCAVVEGCVAQAGTRRLVHFATNTQNAGTGNLSVGVPPPQGESNETFVWSACHKHHHYANYVDYQLMNATGVVLTARKQGFCLEDSAQVHAGTVKHYTCFNQGISVGWEDQYLNDLACQWIDVTGLPSGEYTLQMTVNPLRTLPESNYDNNVLTLDVNL